MTKMFSGMLVGLALGVGFAGAAQAGDYVGYVKKLQRKYVNELPVKDCTKFNGRWGFYGNLWCTPAEQERFDRWEARNLYR